MYKSGENWSAPEIIDSGLTGNRRSSLKLDALGRPRVSYFGNNRKDLRYAEKNVTWATQEVDNFGTAGLDTPISLTCLTLDTAGLPHITYSFFDTTLGGRHLKYARKLLSGASGAWLVKPASGIKERNWFVTTIATIAPGVSGGDSGLVHAMGPDNIPRIFFNSGAAPGCLKYVTLKR
ncbi:hypothetical protein A2625_03625 [candidate division WOR-1 bacterium RIFCSPHIGHO2_01_FULL_53_15]|uniref:Uncharacterized protein n=1 Tax=candidate division WOR-1 bacterium RIFCSPHIGHO2_01_FULL_53_15 TaxID=1802564 RepID=A0A1F4Q5V3_UNCSA|nr:MAG: hypothetical protein A2625_03625 [candidate division WOR-1 bacterium RIFCSPHIGHO2_01_FULL_53_15]